MNLISQYNNGSNTIWLKTSLYTIAGTTMSLGNSVEVKLINNSSVGIWKSNNIYITRVIGYK